MRTWIRLPGFAIEASGFKRDTAGTEVPAVLKPAFRSRLAAEILVVAQNRGDELDHRATDDLDVA